MQSPSTLGSPSRWRPLGLSLRSLALLPAALPLLACAPRKAGGTVTDRSVILLDASRSTTGTAAATEVPLRRCAELRARLEAVTLLRRGVRAAEVLVLATGAERPAEPVTLHPWDRYQPLPQGILKQQASAGEARRHRQAFIDAIVSDCHGRLKPQDASPIYLGVARALEELTAAGAKDACAAPDLGAPRCGAQQLFVHSDLRETVEPYLSARIKGLSLKKLRPPAPLDLGGAAIAVCGISTTADRRLIGKDAVRDAFKQVLGVYDLSTSCPEPKDTRSLQPIAKGVAP